MTCINISRSAAILALAAVAFSSGCASTTVARGVTGGQLGPCMNKPNCASTQNVNEQHAIKPFTFSGDKAVAKEKLRSILTARSDTRIITDDGDYLRVEFTTPIMRFVDDGEFLVKDGEVDLRSGSRVGYSDLGKNRRRLEEIRTDFEPCCE